MARTFSINVPDHVENEQAYIKAAQARIEGNARRGRRIRWLAAHPDAQRVDDFLNQCGEFLRLGRSIEPAIQCVGRQSLDLQCKVADRAQSELHEREAADCNDD